MLRFLLVGVVNTLVGAGIMFLLYNLAGCSYWLSSAANYIVGGVVSYFLKLFISTQIIANVVKKNLALSMCVGIRNQ